MPDNEARIVCLLAQFIIPEITRWLNYLLNTRVRVKYRCCNLKCNFFEAENRLGFCNRWKWILITKLKLITSIFQFFRISYLQRRFRAIFLTSKSNCYINRYRCTGFKRWWNRDDAIPVSIIDALSYIYLPYTISFYFFVSLFLFFRIFLYSFCPTETRRGKGNLIFRFWNSQSKSKNMISLDISRRECAPELTFDHLFPKCIYYCS